MVTDRQRTCRCASNMAEFLNDIRLLEGILREVNVQKSDIYIPSFRLSIDSIHKNIKKIEDDCYIDASNAKSDSSEVHDKINKMETIKDQKQFNDKKSDILTDLSRMRYGMMQKVKDCSK